MPNAKQSQDNADNVSTFKSLLVYLGQLEYNISKLNKNLHELETERSTTLLQLEFLETQINEDPPLSGEPS